MTPLELAKEVLRDNAMLSDSRSHIQCILAQAVIDLTKQVGDSRIYSLKQSEALREAKLLLEWVVCCKEVNILYRDSHPDLTASNWLAKYGDMK